MSPAPLAGANRAGSLYATRAGTAAITREAEILQKPDRSSAPIATAHQGRGNASLMEADRLLAKFAALETREDVTPEMEPDSPSLTDEEDGEDFDDNEDVTPEMEPNDPSIESSLKATVEGDEDQIIITADEDEHLEVSEEDGDVTIHVVEEPT